MEFDIDLQYAGLSPHEAALYEVLVTEGTLPASRVARRARVPRTLAYKVLGELVERDLVERHDPKRGVATFTAAHPQKLKEVAEQARKKATRSLTALNKILPELTSAYNLAVGKPGVRFYEGRFGVRRVLEDSLTAHETVLVYGDITQTHEYIPEINDEIVRKRVIKRLHKKIIMPDSEKNRALTRSATGDIVALNSTKFINTDEEFYTTMQIYDNKVSYVTLVEGEMIGVIIEDAFIYKMQKILFGQLWSTACD